MASPKTEQHNPQEIALFSTGMTTDLRKVIHVNRKIVRPFQSLQHFDVYSDRLVPKRDWASDSVATANKLSRFTYFDDIGGFTLWGLGTNNSNQAVLLKKDLTNVLAGSWLTPGNNTSAVAIGILQNPWLFGYVGYLYFMTSGALNRYNVATATMTENFQPVSATHTATPVIHPRSGYAYFFFDNSVYRLDPSDNWILVQQVPPNMYITSARPLGNNLAIGAAPLNGNDHSVVYQWDLGETTLPETNTFTESIDWGAGTLMHLANLGGRLVGVSNENLNDAFSIDKGRLVVRIYTGGSATASYGDGVAGEANYITADDVVPTPISASYYDDGEKLYFPAAVPFMGDPRIGIWAVDAAGTFSIDAVEPTISSSQRILSCYRIGKAWFIARSDNDVFRMNDQVSFTAPSIVETTLYGDRFNAAEFFGATLSFEPLLAGQSATLKYRACGTDAWTQLGSTQTKVGATQLQALFTEGKVPPRLAEYQFRVESYGATITGLLWMTDSFDQNIYG